MRFLNALLSTRVGLSCVLAFGVIVRLVQYLSNRSLWLDEATLTSSILSRDFAGLLDQPLDYSQCAPIGFLYIERLFVLLLGSDEWVLRLFPLICGVAALFLFAWLCHKLLSPVGALLAVLLFAAAPYLIYYSSDVKQYGPDALAAVLLLCLAWSPLSSSGWTPGRCLLAGLTAGAMIFVSQTSVFVLAGITLGIGWVGLVQKNSRLLWLNGLFTLLWLAAFAVNYYFVLSKFQTYAGLIPYWQALHAFLPLDVLSLDFWVWFPRKLLQILKSPCGFEKQYLLVLPFLAGAFYLFRRQKSFFVTMCGIAACAIAASAMQRFPFAERVILFIAPLAILCIGQGIAAFVEPLWPARKAAALLIVLLFVFVPTLSAAVLLVRPVQREEMRPLLETLQTRLQPGDRLYIYPFARPAFKYYARRFQWDAVQIVPSVEQDTPSGYLPQIEGLASNPRVWVLFSHILSAPLDDHAFFKVHLDREGKLLEEYQKPGAWLYLYDMSLPSDQRP